MLKKLFLVVALFTTLTNVRPEADVQAEVVPVEVTFTGDLTQDAQNLKAAGCSDEQIVEILTKSVEVSANADTPEAAPKGNKVVAFAKKHKGKLIAGTVVLVGVGGLCYAYGTYNPLTAVKYGAGTVWTKISSFRNRS